MKFIIDTNGLEVSTSMLEILLENEYSHPISVKEIHKIAEKELNELAYRWAYNIGRSLVKWELLQDAYKAGYHKAKQQYL